MIITLGFYKRKPGLTLEQFQTHWRDVHGPLIAGIPGVEKYLKRYVQHHMVPSQGWPGVGPLDYDGFSESWFPSLDARKELHAMPYFQNEMIEDERQFLDMDATRVLMFDNQVVQIGKDYAGDWMEGRL
ncbi:EthD domain-containing protein [Seohaeicola nanhaiensis]|uniref:EthD domain-containing protein n=1 Tax=Seohaeicola nanhaiensis TaxID=1387282 RepID=A0ABV9KLN5_9RHOB